MKGMTRTLACSYILPIALASFTVLASCGGGSDTPPATHSHVLADFVGIWVSADEQTRVEVGSDAATTITRSFPEEATLFVDDQGTGHFTRPRIMGYEYALIDDSLTVEFYDDGSLVYERKTGTPDSAVGEWECVEEEDSIYSLTMNADGTCTSVDDDSEVMSGTYDGNNITFAQAEASATVDTDVTPNTMTIDFSRSPEAPSTLSKRDS
jgi:hypothetical protein